MMKKGEFMIRVENLSKEFKSNKKYPGFKGAIKSFFSTEYITKKAVDDISFEIMMEKSLDILEQMEQENQRL